MRGKWGEEIQMASSTIVIRNGTLIDGSGDAPRKNDALVI